jgi:type I restriction-modification system DNA methylase subunit/restriction endonuclease S subunit
MLTKETRQHIDNARDILVGQLPLPTDQVELITIALIYKFMDDIDESAKKLGGKVTYFKGDLAKLSWRKIISNLLSADERVTKFISAVEGISKAKHIPDLFKSIFKNTFLKFRDGRILKMFMDEINWFTYSHSEELGNAFEYLLNTMGAQGENGQFRTPRNIIDFIVEVVNPQKEDTILDPACGTAGFLISAYNHIIWSNTKGYEDFSTTLQNYDVEGKKIRKGGKLSQDVRKHLVKNLVGYDITPLMQRLSKVNMYLHDIPNPVIHDYDTLSLNTRWNEKFDCILANPPFMSPKGGVQPHDKFRIKANTTEVLFSDYMLEHMNPNGKAGWIVPEGIIFQNNNDYVDLRRWLVEEAGLWAVVSLPAQIFQPYSGVKTSILLVDRKLARERDSIILVKVENDGFSLNTNRTPIDKNDLPDVLKILRAYKSSTKTPPLTKGRTKVGSNTIEGMRSLVLPRREFEKIDSYKAYTTGWEFCRKAFVKVTSAQQEYERTKKVKLTDNEKERAEKTWQRRWDEFQYLTNYNKKDLCNDAEFKTWFDENLKDACIGYGEDPNAPIKMKKGGVYFPEELKKRIDNEREYNLSLEKYTNNGVSENRIIPSVRLGDIAVVVSGQSPSGESYNENKEGMPFYQGKTEFSEMYLGEPRYWTTQETKLADRGDILLSVRAPVGPVNIATQKICIGRGLAAIKAKKDVSQFFLFYFLKSIGENLKGRGGAIFDSINREQIENIPIPLPPLEVQQKIVAEIDGYQKVIDGCNAVIENYKPTFKIDEKWKKVKLGEVCTIVRGSSPRPKGSKKYYGGKVPRLMVADLTRDGMYSTPKIDFLTEEGAKLSRPMKKGDVIITVSGNPGLPTILEMDACIHDGFVGLRNLDTKSLLPEYLYFILSYLKKSHNSMAVGAVFQNLTTDQIKELSIPAPSISNQQEIINELKGELQAINLCRSLKLKMESQIKAVLVGVWGKKTE